MNQMKYYVDNNGTYLGGWDANPPEGATEVPAPPQDARQVWVEDAWSSPPIAPYHVYKLVFIQRQTPEEAATLETALGAEEPKMRLMYNAAEYFLSDDSLFAYLHWVVSLALGSQVEPNFERADELLAPMEVGSI